MKKILFFILYMAVVFVASADDGYKLWLPFNKIKNALVLKQYKDNISGVVTFNSSATAKIAQKELTDALQNMLSIKVALQTIPTDKSIVIGTPKTSSIIKEILSSSDNNLGMEGYTIVTKIVGGKNLTIIAANSDIGSLYGVYHFLRLIQSNESINNLSIISTPKIQNRILNHWDNLNRSVERGYSGISLWNWHTLPDYIDQRYIDYARANASVGINGTVLTNVNANALVLTGNYLLKVKALADVFRPYGIKVYLTAKFSAPVELGGLKTADPLNAKVIQWWKDKCKEIYQLIPDFGGFLIKANSEGQPGPQGYGRTHAEGANMFADALAPYGGIVIWRAFVYDVRIPKEDEHFVEGNMGDHTKTIASDDRFKQAYNEFKPLDGKFKKNVLIQVKNGPIDFQPREPFSPLFGSMPITPLAMEFQITQEYLGQGTSLVFQAPLYKECLNADTYANGKGSTVGKIVDGSLNNHYLSAISGVANIGNDKNWTGHIFGQANWYAFGRLAWDYNLSSDQIADEWIRQTFCNDSAFINPVKKIMLASRDALVNYMTPLGLHHIMGTSHHYGPAPWVADAGRADWNSVYYHRADQKGLGFNRTETGSNALAQYTPEVQQQWNNINTCDERFVLWFHHVPWKFKMKSGRIFWDELCYKYYTGVDTVRWMQQAWNEVAKYIDEERFNHVKMLLNIQVKEALWWRNACLLYFQTFSKLPIPESYEKPDHTLSYYQSLRFSYAPGIGGNL